MAAMEHVNPHKRPAPWRGITACWLGFGIVDACQTVFPMRAEGMQHNWVALFVMVSAAWLPWALATPPLMDLARRYPPFRPPLWRGLGLHLGMLAAIALASAMWYALFEYFTNPWAAPGPRPSYLSLMLTKLSYGVLDSLAAYVVVVVIVEALASRDRLAGARTEAAELRAELSDARLLALRQQLDPHFIFNALNSVCGLVREHQDKAAVQMLVALGDYMRNAVARPQQPFATLGEEVDYLRQYLEIQKFRLGERLQVSIDVPAELLAIEVPNLLLQPLAENAIKHGIAGREQGGAIRVSGTRAGDRLHLLMSNPPAPQAAEPPRGTGIGLSNLRARMRLMYGEDQVLALHRTEAGEIEVRVTLPLSRGSAHVRR